MGRCGCCEGGSESPVGVSGEGITSALGNAAATFTLLPMSPRGANQSWLSHLGVAEAQLAENLLLGVNWGLGVKLLC